VGVCWLLPLIAGFTLSTMSDNGNNDTVGNYSFFIVVIAIPFGFLTGACAMLAVAAIQIVRHLRARGVSRGQHQATDRPL
jgi:hypothetical protein